MPTGPLALSDIADLRQYEREREAFRASVIQLKRLRRVGIGPLVTVVFENRTTMRFQIQEMARAERMLTDERIQGELDVYNALIPAPGELSMTLFVELTTEEQLREWLPKLVGIERSLRLRIGDEVVEAAVDPGHESQLTREEVTASVHYARFSLNEAEQAGVREAAGGAPVPVAIGLDHPNYRYETGLSVEALTSLVADW